MASGLVENTWISSAFTASTFSPRRVPTGVSNASDWANSSSAFGADRHCSHLETVCRTTWSRSASLACESPLACRMALMLLLSNYPAIIAARPSLRQATHVHMAGWTQKACFCTPFGRKNAALFLPTGGNKAAPLLILRYNHPGKNVPDRLSCRKSPCQGSRFPCCGRCWLQRQG